MTAFFTRRAALRLLGALAGLYVVCAAAAWLAAPWAARRALREVPKALPGFTATVLSARFDPLRLALTVRGFSLSHAKLGEVAACDEFHASLQPLDLLRAAVGFRELRLTRPRLVAVIAADGTSVLTELPKPAPAAEGAPAPSAPFIPRLIVHRFIIEKAAVEFESRLPSAPQRLAAYPIDLTLENLSTLPNSEGAYALAARTNREESLAWNGQLSVRPPRLSGSLVAEDIDLSRQATAAPNAPVVIGSGRLDARADYEVTYDAGVLAAGLSGARVSVRDMMWNLRSSSAPPRGPFALEVGPSVVSLRAPLPAAPGTKTVLTAETLIAGRGEVKLEASVAASPLSGGAALSVRGLPLAPFSPLAPPPTQVVIDSGTVSLDAKAVLAPGGAADLEASLSVDAFSLSDAASRRVLASFARFAVDGARASVKTRTASVDRVTLDRPYLRVFRGANGRTNVEDALGMTFSSAPAPPAPAAEKAAPVAAPSAPWRARLKRFSMTGGRALAQDEAVSPAFALNVHGVSASLDGLSTDGRSTATFASKGRVEEAPFAVSGGVRLSSAAAWVDARVKADGIQLSAFTPYSIAVIGYKLDRGTLNLDLAEALAVRQVTSDNKIKVDQLTLGDKVDSPTALNVPVKLGLAILKDRHGVIALDVPIAGSLDDPEFRLLPVVLKTLVNLVVKAATSPFDALSSMLGGGADLGRVAFAPGSSALEPGALASLEKVVSALADRPALFVGVRGAGVKADALALGDAALRRRLRGSEPGAPELTPDELKRVLALHAKTFGAPAASPEEARAKLGASFAAGDADLRALALARAAAIHGHLTGKGLDPARFFTLEPSASALADGPSACELQLEAR